MTFCWEMCFALWVFCKQFINYSSGSHILQLNITWVAVYSSSFSKFRYQWCQVAILNPSPLWAPVVEICSNNVPVIFNHYNELNYLYSVQSYVICKNNFLISLIMLTFEQIYIKSNNGNNFLRKLWFVWLISQLPWPLNFFNFIHYGEFQDNSCVLQLTLKSHSLLVLRYMFTFVYSL